MGESSLHPDGVEVEEAETMLFGLDYIDTVQFLQSRLRRMLRQSAVDAAKRDGKKLLTADDAIEALDRLGLSKIYPDSEVEDGDGS